jgi:hypothetical protein
MRYNPSGVGRVEVEPPSVGPARRVPDLEADLTVLVGADVDPGRSLGVHPDKGGDARLDSLRAAQVDDPVALGDGDPRFIGVAGVEVEAVAVALDGEVVGAAPRGELVDRGDRHPVAAHRLLPGHVALEVVTPHGRRRGVGAGRHLGSDREGGSRSGHGQEDQCGAR